jgi:hypothetical protein
VTRSSGAARATARDSELLSDARLAASGLFLAVVHAEASTKTSDAMRHFMVPSPSVD